MNAQQRARLESMSRVGRRVTFKNKGGGGSRIMGTVEEEVYVMVGDYKHLLQRIRFAPEISWDESDYAYRTGYYTFDARGKSIKWGQYTQFLTEKEHRELLRMAKARGWPI